MEVDWLIILGLQVEVWQFFAINIWELGIVKPKTCGT